VSRKQYCIVLLSFIFTYSNEISYKCNSKLPCKFFLFVYYVVECARENVIISKNCIRVWWHFSLWNYFIGSYCCLLFLFRRKFDVCQSFIFSMRVLIIKLSNRFVFQLFIYFNIIQTFGKTLRDLWDGLKIIDLSNTDNRVLMKFEP